MFKEKRIIHFEELEPTSHKKKGKSDFFEHQVEIPKEKTDSVDKEKKVSEHKEILPIKQFQAIKEKEEEDKKKEQKHIQKLTEELNMVKCPKCESTKIKELKDENLLECIDCKYKWIPKEF